MTADELSGQIERVAEALQAMEARQTRGRIVIVP